MKLEALIKRARGRALAVDGVATVKSVECHSQNAAEVIVTDARDCLHPRVRSRDDEPSLDLVEAVPAWSFDADVHR